MTEVFTLSELLLAAQDALRARAISAILDDLTGRMAWTPEEVAESGRRLGYFKSAPVIIARAREMKGVTEILKEARREPEIYAGSDTIVVRELSAALKRLKLYTSLEEIMADIIAHREPEYPEGTVVQDVDGKFWQRKGSGWAGFGSSTSFLGVPPRPLKVIS